MNFEFHSPYFLLLFLVFIPLIIKDFAKKKKLGINVSTTKNMLVAGNFNWIQKFLKITKYIILSGLILALARPRTLPFQMIETRPRRRYFLSGRCFAEYVGKRFRARQNYCT
jgi:hypothetical protein